MQLRPSELESVAAGLGEFDSSKEGDLITINFQQRVTLDKRGSRYAGAVTPFLTGLKNPVPLAVGADGAVLVGDWTAGAIYQVTATAG